MQKIVRNLRLIISFLGYLFSLYMLNVFGVIKHINFSINNATLLIGVGSVLIVLMSVILTYFEKNSNIMYYILYTIMTAMVIFNANIKSEFEFFCMIFIIIMIAIFCQYLYIFEDKIDKVSYKEATPEEVRRSYAKYILFLLGFMCTTIGLVIGGYKIIQKISSNMIVWFYEKNIFFSVPAIAGFIAIAAICIIFLAMFFCETEED